MTFNAKKYTKIALICALAAIVFTAESLLPPLLFFAPGTKIGLASIFVSFTYIAYGKKEAIIVLATKCLFGAVFSGNIFALYYSIPAGLFSLIITVLLFEFFYPKIGILSISVAAAITHNIVQLIMAAILTAIIQILYYVIFVTAAGIIAGIITGICLYYIIKAIPEKTVI